MADSGVGGEPNGCRPESKWKKLTRAVCGDSGKNSLKMEVFVSGLIKFISDISKETAIDQLQNFGEHRFLSTPKPTPAIWGTAYP